MLLQNLSIQHIPALLWGPQSERVILAVHGSGSSKSDAPIALLAEVATERGYQVLSFDLPEHGDRKQEQTLCKVQTCVAELQQVLAFAQTQFAQISLFANSMGAYFSLLALHDAPLRQSLFLSPVVDMEMLIHGMMQGFGISEAQLRQEQVIPTPIGQTLYWDYYQYVKQHPVQHWPVDTAILYGAQDDMTPRAAIDDFAAQFGCRLTVAQGSAHYFYTSQDLAALRSFLQSNLLT